MSKELNIAEGQALLDKLAMEDPAELIRAIAGEEPKSNGGPAFPWCGDLNECPTINLGMSLRDYFAAKAMACAFNEFDVMYCGDYHHQHELVAELAYAMADAMLAERAK